MASVKQHLEALEAARKSGKTYGPPSALHPVSTLNYIEAVKQQGKMLESEMADSQAKIMSQQSPLRQQFQKNKKIQVK